MEINHLEMEDIINQIQVGDINRFEDLYEISYPHLLHLCLSILKNDHDAQDAVQDTFHKIYVNINKLEHPQQYLAWARRIATNACLAQLRKKSDIPTNDISQVIAHGLPPIPDNLEVILNMERETSLLDLINKLDSQTRDIIMMKYYQGYKVKEIEDILGIKAATIKTRIHRTKKLLRKQIEEQRGKTFALPIALVPTGFIFNECISGDVASSSIIRGPEVLKYTWGQSSSLAKVTFIAGATSVVLGSSIIGSDIISNSSNNSISNNSTTDIVVANVDILSYSDSIIQIALTPTSTAIDYNSIQATIGSDIIEVYSVDTNTGIISFYTDTSYMILQVSDVDGNVSSYGLEMNYQ